MTNKPMLSVERELLEELRNVCGDPDLAEEANAILNKPAAQHHDEQVTLRSKGFTTLESEGGKYRIITAYENRDDAWSDYKALCNAGQPYSSVIAKLKAEIEKYKAGCVDLSSQVRELEHKMDFYKNEETAEELEAYKVAFEEGKKAAMYHSGATLMTYMEVMGKLQRDIIRERKEKGA